MGDVYEWGRIIVTAGAVVVLLWGLSKDRVAADLVPKLELYFPTLKQVQRDAEEHRKDHRLLESQISSVAEHKAHSVFRPLEQRVDAVDRELASVSMRLEKAREETREDFKTVFQLLESINIEIRQLNKKGS